MESPIKNILVYIDGTEESITAAQYALCLAHFTGARRIASYVINTKALGDLVRARIFLKEEEEEYERDLKADAERYLNHVRQLARDKGLVIETRSAMGDVYREIMTMVKQESIDLLVVGKLSRIRSRRDELFDATERAVRGVSCSVLMVKDEEYVWNLYASLGEEDSG